jgi:hypothetical protein
VLGVTKSAVSTWECAQVLPADENLKAYVKLLQRLSARCSTCGRTDPPPYRPPIRTLADPSIRLSSIAGGPGCVRLRGKRWHYCFSLGTTTDGRRIQRSHGGYLTQEEAWEALRAALAEREALKEMGP